MNRRDAKKQEIIRKSIDVIFRQGYNGTGVKDLADAAGIPKGSLYNYFENKEDYIREAMYYYYNEMSKTQFDILNDRSLKPLERIKGFYTSMKGDISDDADFSRGCLVGKMTQEMSGISDLIKRVTDEIHRDIIRRIKVNLDEAVENNELSEDKDTGGLAEFIFNSWQGALLRLKASRTKQTLENFYNVLVEVLLN